MKIIVHVKNQGRARRVCLLASRRRTLIRSLRDLILSGGRGRGRPPSSLGEPALRLTAFSAFPQTPVAIALLWLSNFCLSPRQGTKQKYLLTKSCARVAQHYVVSGGTAPCTPGGSQEGGDPPLVTTKYCLAGAKQYVLFGWREPTKCLCRGT